MPGKENLRNGNIKVLLVDDEKGFADILTKRLNKRNMDVTPVYTGIEAVQIIRKQDFDVAVIMLTGHGSEQAAKEGIEFGAFDYLTKPCELEDLIEKILEAKAKRR